MLGHPIKLQNNHLLPLDAWRMTGKGRIFLILHRINIGKMSYFFTTFFQHSIILIMSKAVDKSNVYIHSHSPFPLHHMCMYKSQKIGTEKWVLAMSILHLITSKALVNSIVRQVRFCRERERHHKRPFWAKDLLTLRTQCTYTHKHPTLFQALPI